MEKFLVFSSDNKYTLNIFDFEKMKIISLKKPYFDVCASVPCKDCILVEE